jgi:hypothetical protein
MVGQGRRGPHRLGWAKRTTLWDNARRSAAFRFRLVSFCGGQAREGSDRPQCIRVRDIVAMLRVL